METLNMASVMTPHLNAHNLEAVVLANSPNHVVTVTVSPYGSFTTFPTSNPMQQFAILDLHARQIYRIPTIANSNIKILLFKTIVGFLRKHY